MFGPMGKREEHQDFLHTGEKSQPSHPGNWWNVWTNETEGKHPFFHTLEKSQPPHPGKISLVEGLYQSDRGKNAEAFFTRWKNLSLPTQVRFHWWNV
jgi:hypothetical protein